MVDGVVYIGGYHGHAVFALNAYTGDLICKALPTQAIPIAYQEQESPTALCTFYSASTSDYNGRLYAFNVSTGKLTWQSDRSRKDMGFACHL